MIATTRQPTHFDKSMEDCRDEWSTPLAFFDYLSREFSFTLDVCASDDNAKCDHYFTKEQDGLSQEWNGVCWMNPPYSKQIAFWVRKAYESSLNGATVVCLLPVRTYARWFHQYVIGKAEIRFIQSRLRFGAGHKDAPFASMVVVYRPRQDQLPIAVESQMKMYSSLILR